MQNPEVQKLLHSILTPALAGAAGTGAASAYFSQKNHDPNETPGQRRRRILRNAMYGTALGGAAGAGIPAGAKMLGQPFFGQPEDHRMALSRGADRAVDFGLKNALPVGVAGVGGYGVYHSDQANKARSLTGLAKSMEGHGVTPQDADLLKDPVSARSARTFGNKELLRSEMDKPDQLKRILSLHAGDTATKTGLPGLFRANERIQATGHAGMGLKDMATHFGGSTADATAALKAHLATQGPLARIASTLATERVPAFQHLRRLKAVQLLAKHLPSSNKAISAVENFNPSGAAAAYSKYIRPSVPAAWESVPPAAKLALLGTGIFGASHLQKKLMGH